MDPPCNPGVLDFPFKWYVSFAVVDALANMGPILSEWRAKLHYSYKLQDGRSEQERQLVEF